MWEGKKMRAEKWGTALTAFFLGLLLTLGSMGSLLTAFDLEVINRSGLCLCWALTALVTVLILRWKHGGSALLLLVSFLAGYLWRRGIATEQLCALIYRISRVYNSAYGWGVWLPPAYVRPDVPADWPLGILGGLIVLVTCRQLCRGKKSWPALLLALLPLAACVVVTDTVPHEIPLFLLATAGLLLLLTDAVRQENALQGLRLTAIAVLPVTLTLLTLFLLFPKETYVNHSETIRQELLEKAQSIPRLLETGFRQFTGELQGGSTRQIDLSAVGPREYNPYPVMDITSVQGGTLYLRGQDFDDYTGRGWLSDRSRQEDFSLPGTVSDTVTLQTRGRRSLYYIPYYPAEQTLLLSGKAENPEKEKRYTFSLSALPHNWRQLAVTGATSAVDASTDPGDQSRYLSLPESTRREAAALLDSLPGGTHTEKADRIAALVCSSARYDRDTPAMPEGEEDFALWFLRESDRGYCVHFATAAVVLLRAADVPARYVTGYMVEALPGKTVTATEEDAHAWAEYYEPLLGAWIPLEATPAAPEEETGPTLQSPLPVPETESPEVTLPQTLPAQTDPAPSETAPPLPVLPAPDPGKLTLLARVLILLAASLLILSIQRSTRLRLRRLHQRTGTPNEQALARWRETELLCRLLKESPGEELTSLAQKAKFSPHTLTPEELARFDSHNRVCLRQLRSQRWYRRLVHQYIYAIY